jgi:hypothetical protein
MATASTNFCNINSLLILPKQCIYVYSMIICKNNCYFLKRITLLVCVTETLYVLSDV